MNSKVEPNDFFQEESVKQIFDWANQWSQQAIEQFKQIPQSNEASTAVWQDYLSQATCSPKQQQTKCPDYLCTHSATKFCETLIFTTKLCVNKKNLMQAMHKRVMDTYTYVYICLYIYIYTIVSTYTCMYACMYVM